MYIIFIETSDEAFIHPFFICLFCLKVSFWFVSFDPVVSKNTPRIIKAPFNFSYPNCHSSLDAVEIKETPTAQVTLLLLYTHVTCTYNSDGYISNRKPSREYSENG